MNLDLFGNGGAPASPFPEGQLSAPDAFTDRVVVGFDLGVQGAAAVADADLSGRLETVGLALPGKTEDLAQRACWWAATVAHLLTSYGPMAVAYEDAHYVGAQAASQNWLRRQEGILLAQCYAREIVVVGVPTPTVRAHMVKVRGVGRPEKGQAKRAAQGGAAGLGWIPAAWVGVKRYEDQADAAWVADWLRHQKWVTGA